MLIKKIITTHGTGGKVLVPASTVGQEAIVLIQDDYQKFRELIANAYILSQMESAKFEDIDSRLKEITANVYPRLALLERVLASKLNVDTQNSDTQKESPPQEPETPQE